MAQLLDSFTLKPFPSGDCSSRGMPLRPGPHLPRDTTQAAGHERGHVALHVAHVGAHEVANKGGSLRHGRSRLVTDQRMVAGLS